MLKFIAKNITVLNISRVVYDEGFYMSKDCHIQFLDRIPVIFDDEQQKRIGWAAPRRVKNRIVVDLEVESTMKSATSAISMISQLYPGAYILPIDSEEFAITHAELKAIILGPDANMDNKIKQLGDKVCCLSARTDLH